MSTGALGEHSISCTPSPLQGFTVGVTADRRRVEQGHLLERLGGRVVYGPTIEMGVPADADRLRAVTDQLLAAPPDYLIATTAIGMRTWFTDAETWGLDQDLAAVLGRARIVARGPKPCGALRQAGLDVWWEEPTERLDAAVRHLLPVAAGATIAVQLYGREHLEVLEPLVAAGARVIPVPVYRWQVPADPAPAARIVDGIITGRLAAVTFTSPPAVEHLFDLARRARLLDDVVDACNRDVVVACVGPLTAAMARRLGVDDPCAPSTGRLGLMVRELAARLHATHRHLVTPDGADVVIQGDSVVWAAAGVTLPHREQAVLAALARRPGTVVARPRLQRDVWGAAVESDAVDAAVSRLRRSLAGSGLQITSVVRRGYALVASEGRCPAPATTTIDLRFEQVSGRSHR